MPDPIVIIGSGFAAYQLVKSIRRQDETTEISIITSDEGHDYNKPDLSHVFSKRQDKADLITLSATQFAEQYNINLFPLTRVHKISREEKCIVIESQKIAYSKLVLATGANPFIPPMSGSGVDNILTLNSLSEFNQCKDSITTANNILVIGGGLIGVEVALDLANAGKKVAIVEPSEHLMSNQLPKYIALELQQKLALKQVCIYTNTTVKQIENGNNERLITLGNQQQFSVDEVLICAGLKPNVQLAQQANIKVNRGICTNNQMQTSDDDIFALGDCAELNGVVRSYLQPILLGAIALSKTLLGQPTEVSLSNMMVKVKTPNYPIQIGGITAGENIARWQFDVERQGIVAKSYDQSQNLIGFVVTQDKVPQAFPLLRELS